MKDPARRDTRGERPERRPAPPLRSGAPQPPLDNSLVPGQAGDEAAPLAPLPPLGDRFEELEVLGSGGSGVVLLARDRARGVTVAIKRLRHPSPDLVRRFLREARTIAALDHPGIVRLEQVLRTEADGVALVLEHVPGPDLESLVRREGALPLGRALELGRAVAVALAHAHARGVIHRDVKPSNILLAPDGGPRVTDFGLALPLEDPHSLALTGGDVCGTLEYMAPEQRVDPHGVDRRADVYGLGATLYRLITGASPHVIRERALPEAAREVVLRCVEEHPAARWQSMQELRCALEGAAARARGAAPAAPVDDPARRLIVAAAGLVALGLLPRDAPALVRGRLLRGGAVGGEVPRVVGQTLGRARGRDRAALLAHAHALLAVALVGVELDRAARWALSKLERAGQPPPAPHDPVADAIQRLRATPSCERGRAAPPGAERVLEQALTALRQVSLTAPPGRWLAEEARWRTALRELAATLAEPALATRVTVELLAIERERRVREAPRSSAA